MIRALEISGLGVGWKPIAEEACNKIVALDGTISQVKEKFGGLRIYYNAPEDVRAQCEEIVQEATVKCKGMCEECGRPGTTRNLAGWFKTVCDYHYHAFMTRKLKPMSGTDKRVEIDGPVIDAWFAAKANDDINDETQRALMKELEEKFDFIAFKELLTADVIKDWTSTMTNDEKHLVAMAVDGVLGKICGGEEITQKLMFRLWSVTKKGS
jgi:hypothetical protein